MIDRIEKKITLCTSRERIWQAISEAERFGAWFGMELDGPFVAGEEVTGRIAPTKLDREVATLQESHKGTPCLLHIDRIEPMHLFSFRWHPYAVDETQDYTAEPMTLVTFELADADNGTLLTITESGFERLPPVRRQAALDSNEVGWTHQAKLIEKYLEQQAEFG